MLHFRASLLPIISQNFRRDYNLRLLTTSIRYDFNLRLLATAIRYDNSFFESWCSLNPALAEYIVIVFDAYAFGRCSNLLALQQIVKNQFYEIYASRRFKWTALFE